MLTPSSTPTIQPLSEENGPEHVFGYATISREYWFSAAHRLEGHPKCGRLHGHNYRVVITVGGQISPATGMVMDYAKMDEFVKPIIEHLDHRYLVSDGNVAAHDPYYAAALSHCSGDIMRLSIPATTAELLASWIKDRMPFQRSIWTVRVDETPRSSAQV